MSGFPERNKQYFPLDSIRSVLNLFRNELEYGEEPDLVLLSIVLGAIENTLTTNRVIPSHLDKALNLEPIFPVVDLATIETLYYKFVNQVKHSIYLSGHTSNYASRSIVKNVSDVIWSSLTKSFYKDKAHLQSLYSYLTGSKLDCFGLAFSVVAGCQVLGFNDVHLSLSEDHAWVVFGEDGMETAEVTWHGKGNEDKRGQPISMGTAKKSWLYLNGQPVTCTRHMEVAAMVSSINTGINSTTDSVELGSLQQELLWMLYDMGHLKRYPMAVGNLADCEEVSPTPDRKSPIELFKEAIESAAKFYNNQHVYPYTYLGGYFYRKGQNKAAFKAWSQAADVIRRYNYSREDEEIYKEFLEIANELIPCIIKTAVETSRQDSSMLPTNNNNEGSYIESKPGEFNEDMPLLKDPVCYKYLLTFYDGICQWEEDSSTSVLHSFWAKHFVHSLSKFEPEVRHTLCVAIDEGDAEERSQCNEVDLEPNANSKPGDTETKPKINVNSSKFKRPKKTESETEIKHTIQVLESRVGGAESQNETPNPSIAALAHACSDSILNPDYLLGSGEPFSGANHNHSVSPASDKQVDVQEFLSSKTSSSPFSGMTMDSLLKADTPVELMIVKSRRESMDADTSSSNATVDNADMNGPVVLCSEKMKAMKDLLFAEKLNASAIKLQLTAQSQVHTKHTKLADDWSYDGVGARKRSRRE